MTNNFSYTGTTNGSANTASSFVLAPRWNYISVQNQSLTGTAGAGAGGFWVRTDGNAAVVTGNDDLSIWVDFDSNVLIANMLPLWTQAALVLPSGASTNNYAGTGMELYGGVANPGVSVSIISAGTAVPFTIAAAG